VWMPQLHLQLRNGLPQHTLFLSHLQSQAQSFTLQRSRSTHAWHSFGLSLQLPKQNEKSSSQFTSRLTDSMCVNLHWYKIPQYTKLFVFVSFDCKLEHKSKEEQSWQWADSKEKNKNYNLRAAP
jgi:hypothetical protein